MGGIPGPDRVAGSARSRTRHAGARGRNGRYPEVVWFFRNCAPSAFVLRNREHHPVLTEGGFSTCQRLKTAENTRFSSAFDRAENFYHPVGFFEVAIVAAVGTLHSVFCILWCFETFETIFPAVGRAAETYGSESGSCRSRY